MSEHAASIQAEEITQTTEGNVDKQLLQDGETGHSTAATIPANPFNRDDIAQFDAEDVEAGRFIGKMLSWFFLYTIIAMTIVVLWTYSSIG